MKQQPAPAPAQFSQQLLNTPRINGFFQTSPGRVPVENEDPSAYVNTATINQLSPNMGQQMFSQSLSTYTRDGAAVPNAGFGLCELRPTDDDQHLISLALNPDYENIQNGSRMGSHFNMEGVNRNSYPRHNAAGMAARTGDKSFAPNTYSTQVYPGSQQSPAPRRISQTHSPQGCLYSASSPIHRDSIGSPQSQQGGYSAQPSPSQSACSQLGSPLNSYPYTQNMFSPPQNSNYSYNDSCSSTMLSSPMGSQNVPSPSNSTDCSSSEPTLYPPQSTDYYKPEYQQTDCEQTCEYISA